MPGATRLLSIAYGIWLFGIFAYFVPAATWNPVSRFDLTRALVENHTTEIDPFVENTGDRSFRDGHWYTDKAPVASFLAVPAYAAFRSIERRHGREPGYSAFSTRETPALRVLVNRTFQRGLYVSSLSTAGLGGALLGVLLFRWLARRTTPLAALVGSAGTVLASPLFPYATSFYGHGVAAAFLAAAFVFLFEDPIVAPSRTRVGLAGLTAALAAGTEYLALLPALSILAGFLVSRPRSETVRHLTDLGLGALGPSLFVAAYHTVCFGAPHHTGYSFLVRPEFTRGHASGLMGLHLPTPEGVLGLLFGGNRGLFALAPVTFVSFAALAWESRSSVAARTALVAFLVLLAANAGYYMWWGGAAAGPRHLVPVLPFLALGLARLWSTRLRLLVFALLVVSFANVLVLTAVGLEAPDHGNILFDYAYPRFLHGELASLSGAENLGIRLGLVRGGTLGPLLVWVLLGARVLVRLSLEPSADASEADAPPPEPSVT